MTRLRLLAAALALVGGAGSADAADAKPRLVLVKAQAQGLLTGFHDLKITALCPRGHAALGAGWTVTDADDVPYGLVPVRQGARLGWQAEFRGVVLPSRAPALVKLTAICGRGAGGLRVRAAGRTYAAPRAPTAVTAAPTLDVRVVAARPKKSYVDPDDQLIALCPKRSIPVGFGYRHDAAPFVTARAAGRGSVFFSTNYGASGTEWSLQAWTVCLTVSGLKGTALGYRSRQETLSVSAPKRSGSISRTIGCPRGSTALGLSAFSLTQPRVFGGPNPIPVLTRYEPLRRGRGTAVTVARVVNTDASRNEVPGEMWLGQPCLVTPGWVVDGRGL